MQNSKMAEYLALKSAARHMWPAARASTVGLFNKRLKMPSWNDMLKD